MSKVSNVIMMLEYLSTKRKYSIKELSEKLEVSPRMIRVYKTDLEKAGIYIDTIKGPYGGYVLKQDISIVKENINSEPINLENKELYNTINKAIRAKRKCLIEYCSKDKKKITKRIIHPYHLFLLNNEWGVASYCELKKEIRHFYINRIKAIKILENF